MVKLPLENPRLALFFERQSPGDHLKGEYSCRVQISSPINSPSHKPLWRHVVNGTEDLLFWGATFRMSKSKV